MTRDKWAGFRIQCFPDTRATGVYHVEFHPIDKGQQARGWNGEPRRAPRHGYVIVSGGHPKTGEMLAAELVHMPDLAAGIDSGEYLQKAIGTVREFRTAEGTTT